MLSSTRGAFVLSWRTRGPRVRSDRTKAPRVWLVAARVRLAFAWRWESAPTLRAMTASRRSFLLGTGATAAAAALVTPGSAQADIVVSGGRPDSGARRFTLAVIPDTQYMFDLDRGDSAPLKATLQYLIDHQRLENIVFVSHLGD